MEITIYINQAFCFIGTLTCLNSLFVDLVCFDLFFQQVFNLMDESQTSLFTWYFFFPNENLPEKYLLLSSGNELWVLKSFMEFMFIENSQDVLLNSCQEFKQILMHNFPRIEHGNKNLMFYSKQLFHNVHFFVNQDIL